MSQTERNNEKSDIPIDHSIYLYLLQKAHIIAKLEKDSKEKGEEFHASEVYYPINKNIQIILRIKVLKEGENPVLVMIARHPKEEEHRETLLLAANLFLAKEIQKVEPSYIQGPWMYHIFFTSKISDPIFNKT